MNVQLTEKGAQYASRITPKNALIQVAKDKAINARNIQINNNSNTAQAEVTWCYSDLTPFPLAIGLKNDEPMVYNLDKLDEKRTVLFHCNISKIKVGKNISRNTPKEHRYAEYYVCVACCSGICLSFCYFY
mgnify:CR=1 FL=1